MACMYKKVSNLGQQRVPITHCLVVVSCFACCALMLTGLGCTAQRAGKPERRPETAGSERTIQQENDAARYYQRWPLELSFTNQSRLSRQTLSELLRSFANSGVIIGELSLPSTFWSLSDDQQKDMSHIKVDFLRMYAEVEPHFASILASNASIRRLHLHGRIGVDIDGQYPHRIAPSTIEELILAIDLDGQASVEFVSRIMADSPRLRTLGLRRLREPSLLYNIDFGNFSGTLAFESASRHADQFDWRLFLSRFENRKFRVMVEMSCVDDDL